MNIVGLMLRAMAGTVENGLNRLLEMEGAPGAPGGEGSEEPEPTPSGAGSTTEETRDPSRKGEVVEAVFPPEGEAGGPGEAGAGGAGDPSRGEAGSAGEQPPAPETESGETASGRPSGGEGRGGASPAEAEADAHRVLELLEERGGPLRGYEIAEATGIAPWWRLKEVLHELIRRGQVVQESDGLFAIGRREEG